MKLEMNAQFSAAVVIGLALLSGCANTSEGPRFSWYDGWRKGTVTAVGEGSVFLADRIESQIFVAPELVTQGLFQIVAFNVKTTY